MDSGLTTKQLLFITLLILLYFAHGVFSYGCAQKQICRTVCLPNDVECKQVCKPESDWL